MIAPPSIPIAPPASDHASPTPRTGRAAAPTRPGRDSRPDPLAGLLSGRSPRPSVAEILAAISGYDASRVTRLNHARRMYAGQIQRHRSQAALNRARELTHDARRNNTVARALANRTIDMVWADGPALIVQSGDKAFDDAVLQLWEQADGRYDHQRRAIRPTSGVHDAFGRMSRDELACSVLDAWIYDGDVLVALAPQGRIQLIEAQRIDTPMGGHHALPSGNSVVDGVELDPRGLTVAYHVGNWSPYGSAVGGPYTRIPASIAYLAPNPIGQQQGALRGEPALIATVLRLMELEQYQQAVRVNTQLQACFGVAVKTNMPAQMQAALETPAKEEQDGHRLTELYPGMVVNLRPGESIDAINPGQPGQRHVEYINTEIMLAAIDLGMPLHLALLDPRISNLAGQRALANICERHWLRWQAALLKFYSTLYQHWLAWQIRSGALPLPADESAWHAHAWIPPAAPMLDTRDQIAAELDAIRGGLSTRTEACQRLYGRPFEATARTLAAEHALLRGLGVPVEMTPGAVISGGIQNAPDNAAKDEVPS